MKNVRMLSAFLKLNHCVCVRVRVCVCVEGGYKTLGDVNMWPEKNERWKMRQPKWEKDKYIFLRANLWQTFFISGGRGAGGVGWWHAEFKSKMLAAMTVNTAFGDSEITCFCGRVVRELDTSPEGRGFDSRSGLVVDIEQAHP